MPEISRFYGIVIALFFGDHNPPHFHARYGDTAAVFDMRTLQVLEGALPPRALGLVVEWASQHQRELLDDWDRVRSGQPPQTIAPLP